MKGNWKELKGEYGELTNNDLTYAEGQEDLLLGQLQQKLGKTKDEIKGLIDKI